MVVRIGKTRRYEASPGGAQDVECSRSASEQSHPAGTGIGNGRVTTNELDDPTVLDEHYQTLRKEMLSTLRELGFAA